MAAPRPVRLAGYAPAGSTHGDGLDTIAAGLREALGDAVDVEVDHNILDQGRRIGDLPDDVEAGVTTLCFFSTSYLADRVPELGIVDLPYVFPSLADAHRRLDGDLGARLSAATRAGTDLLPMGYWDTGFRHVTNRWREIRVPDDCRGLRIRLQPNWAHEALFRELGAEPVRTDLRDGIAMLADGRLDAQENPLGNTVAYGVHELHPHVTMTGHVYGARGLYASAAQLADWSDTEVAALERAVRAGIEQQRRDAETLETSLRRSLEADGIRFVDLTPEQHAAFRQAATPVLDEARRRFDDELWAALGA